MINPYENRSTTNRSISAAEKIMRITATITTSGGSFIWGRSTALQYLPEGWDYSGIISLIFGALAAGVSAWLTDLMFGQLLQRVVYDLLASRHPNVTKWNLATSKPNYFKGLRRAEGFGITLVLIGLFIFDAYTTLVIRDPVADQARQQSTIDIDGMRAKIQADQEKKIADLRADSKAKAREIADAERNVLASSPALAKLQSDGNAWAASELAKKKAKATRAAAKNRADIESGITTTMSADAAYLQARVAEAEALNAKAGAATERNRSVFSGMYLAFTIIPKLLSIILRVLMVVSFLAYSHNFTPDLTGDGIIDYEDVEEYYRRQKAAAAKKRAAGSSPDADPAFR